MNREGRPGAGPVAVGRDAAAVEFRDALHDGQAETGRALATGGLRGQSLESTKEPSLVFRGEARAAIAHAADGLAVQERDGDVDRLADRRVLDGVADEIVDRLAQP